MSNTKDLEVNFNELETINKIYDEIQKAHQDSILWGMGIVRITENKVEAISFPKLMSEINELPEDERQFLLEQYEMMVHRGEE